MVLSYRKNLAIMSCYKARIMNIFSQLALYFPEEQLTIAKKFKSNKELLRMVVEENEVDVKNLKDKKNGFSMDS